jgi:hypothetical protein
LAGTLCASPGGRRASPCKTGGQGKASPAGASAIQKLCAPGNGLAKDGENKTCSIRAFHHAVRVSTLCVQRRSASAADGPSGPHLTSATPASSAVTAWTSEAFPWRASLATRPSSETAHTRSAMPCAPRAVTTTRLTGDGWLQQAPPPTTGAASVVPWAAPAGGGRWRLWSASTRCAVLRTCACFAAAVAQALIAAKASSRSWVRWATAVSYAATTAAVASDSQAGRCRDVSGPSSWSSPKSGSAAVARRPTDGPAHPMSSQANGVGTQGLPYLGVCVPRRMPVTTSCSLRTWAGWMPPGPQGAGCMPRDPAHLPSPGSLPRFPHAPLAVSDTPAWDGGGGPFSGP